MVSSNGNGCGLILTSIMLWAIFSLISWWFLQFAEEGVWKWIVFGLTTQFFMLIGRGIENVRYCDFIRAQEQEDGDNKE